MRLSHFFIDRPIFAAVISAFITIAGAIAMTQLPISEYPQVVPPSVIVRASYPGANPKVVAQTVAAPLEQAIVGVKNMLYMSSTSTMDGSLALTITFRVGTDIDRAQTLVQNRVSQALPRLPSEVRNLGVTTTKSSPDLTMVVHLYSPDNRYDTLYLRNYAVRNVRDVLRRLRGMGDVQIFGGGNYAMRIWLDPQKLASLHLTAGDVVSAIRAQNIQVAAGQIGAPPDHGADFQLALNAMGRLQTPAQFRQIVLKTGANGQVVRLGDVSRVDMGAQAYGIQSYLDNQSAVAIPIFQAPGSNALQLSQEVRAAMAHLSKTFPQGMKYAIVYDPTVFVRQSIDAVIHTLLEAVLLVVLVVILFLQTWRASIIPLIAVPVSIIGTFAVLLACGFSINTLSLFGLVLAIGIVVDDAIVVVENVERHIGNGQSPREAAKAAMSEVSRPIIAITLVLCAVFVPVAFVSGLTGEFYRQFALTIALSTVISAFNSLTLSPALAAVLLKPHGARPDALTRLMDRLLGGFFRRFNRGFERAGNAYQNAVVGTVRRAGIALAIYAGLIGLAYLGFATVPHGFIPEQDKQYLVAIAQLPPASSLARTERVIKEIGAIGMRQPGVEHAVQFAGMSVNGFVQSSSAGLVFFALKPFSQRRSPSLSAGAIAAALNRKLGALQGGMVVVFPPPPVMGLGTLGGFKLEVEDRNDAGSDALYAAVQNALKEGYTNPALAGLFSSYQVNVPQLDVHVDRVKVMQDHVNLDDVFQTLQVYLGSLYINDFNRFGRTYEVIAQADAPFRSHVGDIPMLQTRNADGQMIPLGSFVSVHRSFGPDIVQRYNGYTAADINGGPAPGHSSGAAQAAMTKILHDTLPPGMSFEWTDLAYQQLISGDTAAMVFPLCVLFVFLVLAAQYESLTLPLAIILIVPMCLLAAITGVLLDHGTNNVFTQVGLFVLVGLACKNAILIVEFAKHLQEEHGHDPVSAVLQAARLRLRPILMTSFAFIMGVVPLMLASGAGAEIRHALGTVVFAGMLGVTIFGLLLTPVFYVLIRRMTIRRPQSAGSAPEGDLSADASHAYLRIALGRLVQARALRNQSLYDLAPTVTASGGYSKQRVPAVEDPFGGPYTTKLYDAGLDATWELDLFGGVRRGIEARNAQLQGEVANLHDAQIAVIAEVARGYFELRGEQTELAVARANVRNQQQVLALAQAQLQAGSGTDLDVARAKAQLDTTLSTIGPLEAAVSRSIHRLSVLTGRQPDALTPVLIAPHALPPLPPIVPVGTPEELLRRRPDIRAAERNLAASTDLVGVAISNLFPKVTFTGSFGYAAAAPAGFGPAASQSYTIGPGITWAAFNLGRVREQIAGARAGAVIALDQYRRTVLDALEQTEDALVTHARDRDQLLHAADAARESATAARLAEIRYEGGMVGFLSVLDAERTELQSEDAEARARTAAATSLIGVYAALGGGWETAPLPRYTETSISR